MSFPQGVGVDEANKLMCCYRVAKVEAKMLATCWAGLGDDEANVLLTCC